MFFLEKGVATPPAFLEGLNVWGLGFEPGRPASHLESRTKRANTRPPLWNACMLMFHELLTV
jgi:hypothetical protein